jgi:hypothetical protein
MPIILLPRVIFNKKLKFYFLFFKKILGVWPAQGPYMTIRLDL